MHSVRVALADERVNALALDAQLLDQAGLFTAELMAGFENALHIQVLS